MKTNPTADCPTEEQILGWADGTLVDRTRVDAHVADCELCLDVVAEIVSSVDAVAGAALEEPPLDLERRAQGRAIVGTAPSWRERLFGAIFSYRAAAAVAVASVAALVVVQLQDHAPSEAGSSLRDGSSRIESLTPTGPSGDTSAMAPATFTWDPVPGMDRYVITIVDAGTGRTVVRKAVSSPAYELDSTRVRGLVGHPLEWMVECTGADGRTVQSVAVPFRFVAPPGVE